MNKEERIREICEININKFGKVISDVVADSICEGYKLGFEECLEQLKKNN